MGAGLQCRRCRQVCRALYQRRDAVRLDRAALHWHRRTRTYFSKLPAGIKVKMGDQQAIAAGPDVVLSSGFADFTLPNGTVLPFRLTLAFVKVDGKWRVAQHHGSPLPK
nr:nuclear transport factor 2 family protein [Bradyrhizobium sp. CCGUVB23]